MNSHCELAQQQLQTLKPKFDFDLFLVVYQFNSTKHCKANEFALNFLKDSRIYGFYLLTAQANSEDCSLCIKTALTKQSLGQAINIFLMSARPKKPG